MTLGNDLKILIFCGAGNKKWDADIRFRCDLDELLSRLNFADSRISWIRNSCFKERIHGNHLRPVAVIKISDGLPRWQGSRGQQRAHLGPVVPRWALCWPYELCFPTATNLSIDMADLAHSLVCTWTITLLSRVPKLCISCIWWRTYMRIAAEKVTRCY